MCWVSGRARKRAAEDVVAQRSGVCTAAMRGTPSSLWQGDGSSLRGFAPNRQVLRWRRERRGDGLRSSLFGRAKGKRKLRPLPRAGWQEGGAALAGRGRQESPWPLESWDHLGPHWRDVFSCLEHNCQWKSLGTDFSAQKHCGLGHFGEDF